MPTATKLNQRDFTNSPMAAEKNDVEIARKENEAILQLRQLLKGEAKLNARIDDEFLRRFVRVRKCDVDAALRTVQNYYGNRAKCPQVYSDFVPSSIDAVTRNSIMILPSKDIHGRHVLLHKAGFQPLERGTYERGQKALLLCLERIAADPVSQTTGMTFIVDSDGFNLNMLFRCNLGLMRRFLEYLQDCMPMKLKALHFVHESGAIDVLYGVLRPFLKRKFTERLHFHGKNYENLLKEMPPNTLPKEYGGEADALDFEGFWRQLEEEEALFVENNTFGYVDGNAGVGDPR